MKYTFALGFFIFVCLSANAQCYPDRHNNSWNEGWLSCEARLNPNPDRGMGHWIMYDFGHTYALGQVHVWNYNGAEYLNMGTREMAIDISVDGQNWVSKGNHIIEMASGKSRYQGIALTHLEGDSARYVILTALENYGGGCTGLSEVKFDVMGHIDQDEFSKTNACFNISVYPNPHVEQFALEMNSECQGDISYQLYDHTGRLSLQGRFSAQDIEQAVIIPTAQLRSGVYHLVVMQNEEREQISVVKINR